jgi:hypothetical protein
MGYYPQGDRSSINDVEIPRKLEKVQRKVVTVSIVFIYKCITGSITVNQCMGFNDISLVMEGIFNDIVISISFILINYRKP